MTAAARGMGWLRELPGQFDGLVVGPNPSSPPIGPNRDASEDFLAGAAPTPDEFVRLVPSLPPFRDQEDANVCVPTAVLNVAEATLKATTGMTIEPGSVGQPYAIANALTQDAGSQLGDFGSFPRVVMQVVKEWGVAPDRIWPFRDPRTRHIVRENLITRPPPDVLQNASSWKLDEQLTIYATGADRLRTIDATIAGFGGVPTAGIVDGAFMSYRGRGVLGPPDPQDDRGRHMVAIVGYRTNKITRKREYLIRNSWSEWGLILMKQPSLAWVSEEWVLAQEELFRLRISRGRRTS